jgi:hypothetical protein
MTVYGKAMQEVPREEWPFFPAWETIPMRVWRSKDYLAVLYKQRADGMVRLTVNSVRRKPERKRTAGTDWRDGITWDELQRVKNETLGPDVWCVEVYPAQDDVVDVANMRHLWPLDEPPKTRFPKKAVTSDADIDAALRLIRQAMG